MDSRKTFEENTYDLVYSAATIQWIPEEIAFTKTFQMLKAGIREAFRKYGDRMVIMDTIPLYLVQKP